MATHKSAIKRQKQNEKKRIDNQVRRTRVKNLAKDVVKAVETRDVDAAQEALKKAVPVIQKAAAKRTIHPRTAARKISRLTRRINSLKSA